MKPRIQDFKFTDYVRAAHLGHAVQVYNVAGVGNIGAIYLDPAWLETKHWFPITNDAVTAHDFFGAFNRIKTNYLYTPEIFAELASRAHELNADVDYERAFVLGSHVNYWHFTMDCIPRLIFLFENGDPTMPLLVSPDHGDLQQSILDHVFAAQGLKTPRIIRLPSGIAPIRRAIFPSLVSVAAGVALWDRLLPPPKEQTAERLLFLKRGNVTQRRLLNEEEIMARVARRGFELIDPGMMTFTQQIETFRNARIVLAPHGAAMTNIVFAPPGGVLVELMTGLDQPFFAKLAHAKRWRRILIRDRNTPETASHNTDMRIDAAEVDRVMDELGL